MGLLLKPPRRVRREKLQVMIDAEVHADLVRYHKAMQDSTGDTDLNIGEVVESMLRSMMEGDKEFQRIKKADQAHAGVNGRTPPPAAHAGAGNGQQALAN